MQSVRLIQFCDLEPTTLNNPLCIVGMPGIADIGKFAVDQLIGIFQAEKYCEIIFNDYPAGAIVDDSIISTPKAEILFYRDPKQQRDIIFVTADAQAMTPRGIYEISDYIVSLISALNVSKILSLGAFPVKKGNKNTIDIFISSTESSYVEEFTKNSDIKRVTKGVIIGSNGLIPALAKARFNIDGIVLLAETDNSAVVNENMTDLEASIQLLEKAGELFSLPIKSTYSQDRIAEITKDIESKRKQLEDELDTIQPYMEMPEVDKSLYI